MDLSSFSNTAKKLQSNRQLKGFGWPYEICRHFEGSWFRDEVVVHASDPLHSTLVRARSEKKARRTKNALSIYISSIDAVLVVQLPSRTRKPKVEDFEHHVVECVEAADHQFNATHDKLTRLLNRTGFETEFVRVVKKSIASEEEQELKTVTPSSTIALIVADIDYFKQVNDSYGHQYGDAVLRAFAWRLEEQAKKLRETQGLEVVLCRPGGEEFEILVGNLRDPSQVEEISQSFRQAIKAGRLPSDEQWASISRDLKLESSSLPPETERNINASFGYGAIPAGGTDIEKKYANLKRRADAALYRAKADGRDCVRNWTEIRRRHGKVHKHHVEMDVVVIDIGTDVGVTIGDCYNVYNPEFVGEVAITQADHRSTRKLGTYPKIAAGRVCVIDTQKEISTCQVLERCTPQLFAPGSSLEYVPSGIGRPHVRSATAANASGVLSAESLLTLIEGAGARKSLSALAVFSIDAKLLRLAGREPRTTEQMLSLLVSRVRTIFPPTSSIGLLRSNRIAVLVEFNSTNPAVDMDTLKAVLDVGGESVRIRCGALFRVRSDDEIEDEALSDVSFVNYIERNRSRPMEASDTLYLAEMACFVAMRKKPASETEIPIEIFHNETPGNALYEWRRAGSYEEAIVDYHRLRAIGVDTPSVSNQVGLCMLRQDETLQAAERAFNTALKETPGEIDYVRLNLAIAQTALGKHKDAFSNFDKCNKQIEMLERRKESLYWLYHAAYAKSALECFRQKLVTVSKPRVLRSSKEV